VITWAWRRAVKLAEDTGDAMIKVGTLRDFVDRIEVLFVLSQMLGGGTSASHLPGTEYLAPWLDKPILKFGGDQWEKRRKERAYSTSLSAPINYGPGLKSLGWLRPHHDFPEVLVPNPETSPALDSLEDALRPALRHEAFNKLGNVTVTQDEIKKWAKLWPMDRVSIPEATVMSALLMGETASPQRRLGLGLMFECATSIRDSTAKALRAAMSGEPSRFTPSPGLLATRDKWRSLQIRQLFRLSLEAILYWMMLVLEDRGPLAIDVLVDSYLAICDPHGESTTSDWLKRQLPEKSGPIDVMDRIWDASVRQDDPALVQSITAGLSMSLSEPIVTGQPAQRPERLPLARAKKEADSRGEQPVCELIRHIFESWVLAQHAYWAVGRGLADARSGGRTLLRLRVILDEGGWDLTPGIQYNSPPRPTADRLETAISLARECKLFDTG